jgi:4-hydroxybenzoyl-CoA reductase subunit alpha
MVKAYSIPEPEKTTTEDLKIVGKPFRRVDGRAKVTGQTRFADDLQFPRMAHVKLVRSTVPHARIKSIDFSGALAMYGVLGTLVGEETPDSFGIMPVSEDEHALAIDTVRFVGDPVAAIAAVSEDIAHAAALAVKVEYEVLPTISSVDDALATPEPQIHDYADDGNMHKKVSLKFGDVEQGFDDADLILEDNIFYEGNTHLALEQHSAIAVTEDDDRVTVYSSTQCPHYVHRALTKTLDIPASRIRVIACSNGGGFGGKSDPFNHEIIVAKLALKLGRPVKMTLTREEVFYCHRGRHPVQMHVKTGFRKDGTMTSQHLRTTLDGGAFGSYGVASTYYTGALQTTTYKLPNYWFEGARAFTNKPPCGPKRGHGTPQPRFAYEIHLDKAAHELGIDPAELRLRNIVEPDSITANWLRIGTCGLKECIDAVVKGSGWKERYGKLPEGRGLGLACSGYMTGAGLPIYWNHMPHSGVQLQLDRSGNVAVFCGEAEIGQGSDSVIAVMVAEVLGIDLKDIRLCVGDTDLTPVDLGSYSSRVTLMAGQAAIQAAERARDKIAEAVGEQMELPKDSLVFADGQVFPAHEPGKAIAFSEAVVMAESRFGTLGTTGSYIPPRSPGRFRGSGVGPSPTYTYSASVLEVEVDSGTGLYDVKKVWMAHDLGRALNPVLALGQIEGSIYMGLGEAVMEEQAFRRLPKRLSPSLVHKMPSMLEYKSPGFHDMPEMVCYMIETDDERGPYGAKEAGQGPLLPVLPALANAIFDAVGVRIDQVPIHPDMILKALHAKQKGREARVGPKKFPNIDYGTPVVVHTPEQGGDGRAADDPKSKSKGLRSASGTMKEREDALKEKSSAPLTTD